MENQHIQTTQKNISFILPGLIGISLVILIHELGHFLFACYFGVPVKIFSLGFGPALIKFPIKGILFQIALLPFGGYVELDEISLAAQPYIPKMIIMLAGIGFNYIFSYGVISYFSTKKTLKTTLLKDCMNYIKQEKNNSGIIGPIGLISIIGRSYQENFNFFWIILALVSLNIGIFNLLPLPFFDGGKALLFTIEAATNSTISQSMLYMISFICFIFFGLMIIAVSMKDAERLKLHK